MDDECLDSLTEGCFVVQPHPPPHEDREGFVPLFDGEDVTRRRNAYHACWEAVQVPIKEAQRATNDRTPAALAEFVRERVHILTERTQRDCLPRLPAAIVSAGVNVADHAEIFHELAAGLRRDTAARTANLRASSCATLAAMTRELVEQLVQPNDLTRTRMSVSDFKILRRWYHESFVTGTWMRHRDSKGNWDDCDVCHKNGSLICCDGCPGAFHAACLIPSVQVEDLPDPWYCPKCVAKETMTPPPPLVVVVEDVECFPCHVLCDFLLVCSDNVPDLPLVLILGLDTSVEQFLVKMPRHVLLHLDTVHFRLRRAVDCLDAIVDHVLLSDAPLLWIGPRTLSFLIDDFLLNTFTVERFLRALHFVFLEHFYHEPLSFLCVPSSTRRTLHPEHLERIRALPSVQGNTDLRNLNDKTLEAWALKLADQVPRSLGIWTKGFALVYATGSFLSCRNLPTKLGGLIDALKSSRIMAWPFFEEIKWRIKGCSLDTLTDLVRMWMTHIGPPYRMGDDEDAPLVFEEERGKLDRILAFLTQEHVTIRDENKMGGWSVGKRRRMALTNSTPTLRKVEHTRTAVLEFLTCFVTSHMPNPNEFPLFEVYHYNKSIALKKAFNGNPRHVLQSALSTPRALLHCRCCRGPLTHTMEDTCIAFKLFQGSGRLINVFDWLDAFSSICERSGETEEVIQARFARAIAELHLLGYIKRSSRKAGYVGRVVFGHAPA